MKLKLSLLLFCLLGIGIFSHAQDKKKTPAKPTVENGPDAIPVTVVSKKRVNRKPPSPPPPKVEITRFTAPKVLKNGDKLPPPPPPPLAKPHKVKAEKPVSPDAPPLPDGKTE